MSFSSFPRLGQIVVNALIENPQFTSQTKETLTKRVRDFGSKCEIDDKFISSGMSASFLTTSLSSPGVILMFSSHRLVIPVCRSGIMDNILDLCKAKKTRELKKRDGRKQGQFVFFISFSHNTHTQDVKAHPTLFRCIHSQLDGDSEAGRCQRCRNSERSSLHSDPDRGRIRESSRDVWSECRGPRPLWCVPSEG